MMQMTKQQNWRWTFISRLPSLFVSLQKRASWRVMEISWIPFFLLLFSSERINLIDVMVGTNLVW